MNRIPVNQADYYNTFPEYIEGIAKKFNDKPAVTYFNQNREPVTHTYSQLAEEVFSLAEALYARRFTGKHIAIVGENSYEWLLAYLACASCGAVAVCIDAEQSDGTIHQMILQADCAAVFTSESYYPLCQTLVEQKNNALELFVLTDTGHCKLMYLPALLEEGQRLRESQGKAAMDYPVSPEQTASIVYTSGTTSLSKPVMLGHKAILHNAADAIREVEAGSKVYSSLPFYHSYGMTGAVLDTLVRGAEIYINGNLKTMMRDLHLSCAYSMITVPLMIKTLERQLWLTAEKEGKAKKLKSLLNICKTLKKMHLPYRNKVLDDIRKKMVGDIQVIICGGAYLEKELCETFELFGVLILQGYGITECSPMVSTNGNRYNKKGSVGPVLNGYQLKIVGDEIYVKGTSLMNGYYKQEEETAKVFTKDGWFKTGDLGYLDKDDYLYITGRQKNLIVFKNGKKVSPEKIEEQLEKIPLVKEVMVYGTASGSSADDVVVSASIFPDPEVSGDMESFEILQTLQKEVDIINSNLPIYQQIQMINIREKEFDKTASKKIKRQL